MTILETERLTLRPMTLDDMDDMFLILGHEGAMHYIPYETHQSIEQTKQFYESRLSAHPLSQWAILLKGQDRVIGAINFINARIFGMGYILHPDFWGKGITVEASRAMIDYAFANFEHDRIELWIDETNVASFSVARKLGFQVKGRLPSIDRHTGDYCFLLIYGMLKSDWLAEPEDDKTTETRFFSVDPVLKVFDAVASANYYRDKLGFTVDFLYGDPTYYAIVSRGEWTQNMVSIHFSQTSDQKIEPSAHLHIRVDKGLDALFELYRDRGVSIVGEPDNKPWGITRIFNTGFERASPCFCL